ncbi:MAG: helix-turn-helix domain-containing protein [Acidobacteria bacterium]|nr:helix-turn-helix domain-containing protein [Acidobacteriota bacterium]
MSNIGSDHTQSLLTTTQAARFLKLSQSRVRQFISAGRLQGLKKGRDLLITLKELERFSKLPRKRTGRPKKSLRTRKDL